MTKDDKKPAKALSTATTPIPARHDRIRMCAEAAVDERALLRCYRRRPVRSTTYHRIVAAARALGLPAPPPAVVVPMGGGAP